MTPKQETQLINAIAATFGDKCFDVTSIVCKARNGDNTVLVSALDAAIPNCRYRSGYYRGQFKTLVLRRVLKLLTDKHFDVDAAGWWRVSFVPHSMIA
jgi:hypothetical protein